VAEFWRLLIGNDLLYSSASSQQGGFNKKVIRVCLMKKWFLLHTVLVSLLLPECVLAVENSVPLELVITELQATRARRVHAIWECHRRGPAAAEALPMLIRVLRHEDQQDTALVMSTIAAVGPQDKQAITALLNQISRENLVLRGVAVDLLVRLGKANPRALNVILDHYLRDARAAEVILACGPAAAWSLLGRVLESEGPTQEYYLGLFSGLAKEPEAPLIVLDLAKHVRGTDPVMSMTAMSVLQRFGRLAEGALPELNALLRTSTDPATINAVCTTMGTIGVSGLPGLVRTLESPSETTRMSVITILEMLGPSARPAAPALQKLMKQAESGLMRYRIQAALQAMGY
jgi:hypothetical protein